MKYTENQKYKEGQAQVEAIKNFFAHIIIFIAANILYAVFLSGAIDDGYISQYIPKNALLLNVLIWGTALGIHGLYVFKRGLLKDWYKKWENKKISHYMEDDNSTKTKRYE
jgi:hypothetical protein